MSIRLLKYGFIDNHSENRWFNSAKDLENSYDVVIIGAGGHGLACAYYLSHYHNINKVAVLEKNYIGAGNTGRNTTIIRSNYLTEEESNFTARACGYLTSYRRSLIPISFFLKEAISLWLIVMLP